MANKQAVQIDYLPGWVWIYDGQETWTTKGGKTSTARHAKELLTGNTLSVRDAQTLQRQNRATAGTPKPAPVKRTGKTSSRRGKTTIHGETKIWVFRDLASAQAFFAIQNHPTYKNVLPEPYQVVLVQIRYKEYKNIPANGDTFSRSKGSKSRGRYATLTKYFDRIEFQETNHLWEEAQSKISNYDMSGTNDRVFVYAYEK